MSNDDRPEADNQVFLRGRLADLPLVKELPSGDVLVTFRLTVARPAGDRARVDSLECSTTRARARRTLERAVVGDEVEVEGSLQRRFWRSPAGPASRYAVDAGTIRINRAARGKAVKGDAVREKAAPKQAALEKAVPEKAAPKQAALEKAVPEKAVRRKAMVEDAVNDGAAAGRPGRSAGAARAPKRVSG